MITVYYLCNKRSSNKGSKEVPLLADVEYVNNQVKEHFRFSIGLTCNPKNFIRQEIHGREPNSELKNSILKRLKSISEGIYLEGLKTGKLPVKEEFKSRILNTLKTAEKEKTTLDYFDDYVASLEAKKKSKSFISAMNKLKELITELRDKGISINLNEIDLNFETKFRELMNAKPYKTNTQGAYVKRLKMFLNWAAKNNLHTNQKYKLFDIEEEAREIIALSEIEVEAISKVKIPTHKHILAGGTKLSRDWFVISTQTGLRYSDFKKFSNAKLLPVEGGFDISIKTQKTKTDVVIPVSRLLYNVLTEHGFKVPPPPSNQKYNAALKRIVGLANVEKEISSHTGRKTFCTTMYRKGVPVPHIMKISGHKTEKEFYKYIGVSLTENAALVRESSLDFQIEHTPKMIVNN